MSETNKLFDPFVANASAALYGVENQAVVEENFPALYEKMVESFKDEQFIKKLHSLKGRGKVTVSLDIPSKNEVTRFIHKVWFQVQKSASQYWEIYYVNIGVSFQRSMYNPLGFSKMVITKATMGTIEKITERITSDDFSSKMCKELAEYVYESLSEEVINIMKTGGGKS